MSSAAFKINDLISDEEIEECIDGLSDIKMIREIISVTQLDNLVDIEDFADMFSYKIRNFIDVEIDEWRSIRLDSIKEISFGLGSIQNQ